MPITEGRLIPLDVGRPTENMAIDQALLESVDATGQPVLRFYTWSEPTLSCGYFQSIADRAKHAESAPLTCVRRATGGGAIVHDRELTYSIAVPLKRDSPGPTLDLYRQTHAAVVRALFKFGVGAVPFRATAPRTRKDKLSEFPFLCFQRRTDEDLMLSGYKILGSAQRKTRRAMLQHGSLLLETSQFAPQLPGIAELTSKFISAADLADKIAVVLAEIASIRWSIDEITDSERRRASTIAREKFGSQEWLLRR